jgi:probable addiction module antidote protein
MTQFAPFDVADYLDDEEVIAEYLSAALGDENPDVFLAALADVARARGITSIAREGGEPGQESLEQILGPGMKPNYATVLRVVRHLGLQLRLSA